MGLSIRTPILNLGKSTIVYGLGNTLSKLAAFLLIFVYTRFLSLSDVGILALLEMMEFFLVSIAPLGIMNAVWRYLPGAEEGTRGRIITSAYLFTLFTNVVILGLIGANFRGLGRFLGLDMSSASMILVVLLNVVLAVGVRFLLSLWQYHQKSLAYVGLSLVQFVGILVLTVVFVVYGEWGLWGVLLAKSVVFGLVFILGGFSILRLHWSMPSPATYFHLLKYGLPWILLALVTPVLTVSDRFFLKSLNITLESIGTYSIAYKLGMLINMFLVVPLQRGWGPMMYRLGVEQKSHEFYRDIMFYYAVIGSVLFLLIAFFARDLLSIVATKEYAGAAFIVPIIASAYLINGFRLFFISGAALKDRTPRLALAATLAILLNLSLNYILITHYGIRGAAWSTFISYVALVTFVYFASQKLAQINWGWGRLLKLAIILVGVSLLTLRVQVSFGAWPGIVGLSGMAVFVVLLLSTKTVGSSELRGIKSLLTTIRIRR